MKRFKIILGILFLFTVNFVFSQEGKPIADQVKNISKGDYVILEVRLNMEDEFRTLEGRESQGLARISLFNGIKMDNPLITKGFQGYDQVVKFLNELKSLGFKLCDTYSFRGNSLIITHYIFEKVKK